MLTSSNIVTSVNIKQSKLGQVFILDSLYNGKTRKCVYKDSMSSITTLIDIENGDQYHLCRGHMKYLSLSK